MRVAILERLLRSKMDGRLYEEEKRREPKAKSPFTSEHTFAAGVYPSNGTVRDRLRRFCGPLDGCFENGSFEELGEGEDGGTVRCASIPIWSDEEDEGHGLSSNEAAWGEKKRGVLKEEEWNIQKHVVVEEDDDDNVVAGPDEYLLGWDASNKHSYSTNEGEEEELSAQMASYEQADNHVFGEEDGNEPDAARTTLETILAGFSNINHLGCKNYKCSEEDITLDEAEGETAGLMGKCMREDDEHGEEEEEEKGECANRRLVDVTEHAEMRIV